MDGETSQQQLQQLRGIPERWGNPPAQYLSKLPKKLKNGTILHLDYMEHAQLRAALTAEDPGWTWYPMSFTDDGLPKIKVVNGEANLWIWLTVHGKAQPGVGNALAGKNDILKELIGDALRNAAMTFGFALGLWSKHDELISASQPETLLTEGPLTAEQVPPGGSPADGHPGPLEAHREALKERANQLPPADRGTLRASIELQHLSWNNDHDLAAIELLVAAAEAPLMEAGQ